MGKVFGAICRFVLVLFIVGLVGYNTYEIGRLRAEVATLRGHTQTGATQRAASGAAEQLAEAQSHAERATALLKEKRFTEATKEMQAAQECAARASGNAQVQSRATVAQVQKTLAKLSAQTAALWKQAESMQNAGVNETKKQNDEKK